MDDFPEQFRICIIINNTDIMKSKRTFFLSAAIALVMSAGVCVAVCQRSEKTLFEQNIEALMQQEHAFGGCDYSSPNPCMGYCSDCGALVYAMGSQYTGEGYNIHHF